MCVHWGNYTQHSQEVQHFCKLNRFIVVANINLGGGGQRLLDYYGKILLSTLNIDSVI